MTKEQQEEEEEKKNQALALRYHNDIFQKGMLKVADEILSADFVLHNPTLPEELRKGPEGTKKYASAVIAAVPDRKLVHDDIFAKGDKVLIRWTNSGTNTGPLFGNPIHRVLLLLVRVMIIVYCLQLLPLIQTAGGDATFGRTYNLSLLVNWNIH